MGRNQFKIYTMKRIYLNFMMLAMAAIFLASCEDDDPVVIPKVSISADEVTIAENATSALLVKVTTDAVLGEDYTVPITVSGTAIAGVNYQEIAGTVTIPADETSANIFVTPINVSAIEEDKTVIISLGAGDVYELTAASSVNITITDNATPASDAPTVSFATSNIVTNPYLEEELTITVGLSKAFASDLTIPLTLTGDLVDGTDYEITGLDNNAITIAANQVSAEFTVAMKNTAVVGMNKTLQFGFATPSVTDYAVKTTENTVAINAVDPQVDFSAWLNADNKFNYFFDDQTSTTTAYRTDLDGYWLKRYYFDSVEQIWKTLSGEHYTNVTTNDNNQWGEVINIFKKNLGARGIDIAEQERYEIQAFDYLGLTKYFANEATYGKTAIKAEKGWFRFVTTDASLTEGTVVIPEQTLTLYKADMDVWKEKTTVDANGSSENYYKWYEDSRTTQGDLAQSALVTPVSIHVAKSVGTYNIATKEIQVDVTFTCEDSDLAIDPKYIYNQDGSTYTLRIKYTNRY